MNRETDDSNAGREGLPPSEPRIPESIEASQAMRGSDLAAGFFRRPLGRVVLAFLIGVASLSWLLLFLFWIKTADRQQTVTERDIALRVLHELGAKVNALRTVPSPVEALMPADDPRRKFRREKRWSGSDHIGDIWLSEASTDATLALLRPFAELDNLDLKGCQISDDGLFYVGQLKNLEILNLSGTPITGSGLAHLADLDRLEVIVLTNVDLEPWNLAHLAQLDSLEKVYLNGVIIRQRSVSDIARIKSLRHIVLTEGHITEDALAELAAARPDVSIDFFER